MTRRMRWDAKHEATSYILEAEARGAEEQRRKDAEGQENPVAWAHRNHIEDAAYSPRNKPFVVSTEDIYGPETGVALYTRPANVITGIDIDTVIREISELPDRTSPDDQPELMVVTADELRQILSDAQPANVAALEARVKALVEALKKADYAARKDSLIDAERLESVRSIIRAALTREGAE
ncbi:MAG: hypothetical protein ABF493_10390 [Gluconobacter oxydans]